MPEAVGASEPLVEVKLEKLGVDVTPSEPAVLVPPTSEAQAEQDIQSIYFERVVPPSSDPRVFHYIALEPETLVGLVVSAAFLGALGYDALRTIVDRLREAFPFLSE